MTGNSVTFNALNPGTWSFTVIGYSNALPTAGIAIAAGSGVVSVSPGTTSNLNISVVEYSGSGTLAVTAQWPTTPGNHKPEFDGEPYQLLGHDDSTDFRADHVGRRQFQRDRDE